MVIDIEIFYYRLVFLWCYLVFGKSIWGFFVLVVGFKGIVLYWEFVVGER